MSLSRNSYSKISTELEYCKLNLGTRVGNSQVKRFHASYYSNNLYMLGLGTLRMYFHIRIYTLLIRHSNIMVSNVYKSLFFKVSFLGQGHGQLNEKKINE